MAAVRLGADALGFVFYRPSPRYIAPQDAARIAGALPPFVTRVALFVDESQDAIAKSLEQFPADLLQFHGNEPVVDCERYDKPYLKAVRVRADVDLVEYAARYASAAALLLDNYAAGVPGGTGKTFDWDLIPHGLSCPIVLSGGLDVDNVSAAIERVRPWAVDVSSGVEQSKGVKDVSKMEAFFRKIDDNRV